MNTETLMQIAQALRNIVDRGDLKGYDSASQIVSIVNLLENVARTAENAAMRKETDDGAD